ncbi:HupE/UreJ family protein [Aureimonas leprariae]|uniref:HupE/UreJ family protein n=1 Tax=Plantimonas leprariae TaxID=2615207 RepID=A0A7V7PNR2_9HYPH|nr:HupE/UreJ family protein [Aureimonas leprariae]KAB0679293.1 HupE/UreJ family protein [Aureimonas leprariae]
MPKRLAAATAAAAFLAGAAPAFAHLNPAEHGSLLAGVSHPLTGLDHILAMVAVGLWAAQRGGRAVYAVPAAFVGTMIVGFGLGLAGVTLPFVEPMIAASVLALGVLVASAARLPVAASAGLVGLFALFHGVAHASELGGAGALSFGFGFVLSTAALHAAGIGLGLTLGRGGWAGSALGRLLGAGTAAAGLALMLG